MRETKGAQQGDMWIRNKVGRIGGSRLADVCSYLQRASGAKKAGDSSAARDKYKMELIAERLTGRMADHYTSPSMEWGIQMEDEAARFYETVMGEMVSPVNFVLHPNLDFAGCSPDRLVGSDGLLEIKCPDTVTHINYLMAGEVPQEYMPQVAWELACTERKWADFVSYDPRIMDDNARFFYRRVTPADLIWLTWDKQEIKGEQVLAYFTDEAVKLEREINDFMAERKLKPVAPFAVEWK